MLYPSIELSIQGIGEELNSVKSGDQYLFQRFTFHNLKLQENSVKIHSFGRILVSPSQTKWIVSFKEYFPFILHFFLCLMLK